MSDATGTLTMHDVTRARGVYEVPIASDVWEYGYNVSRCLAVGYPDSARRMRDTVRKIVRLSDADARRYLLGQYREGRRNGIAQRNPYRESVN